MMAVRYPFPAWLIPMLPHAAPRPRRLRGPTLQSMNLGHGRLAVLAAAGALVLVAAAAVAGTGGPHEASRTAPIEVSDSVDAYGINIRMRTSFYDDVTLSAATATVVGTTDDAELWPLDGEDHEGEDLDPVDLPAGTSISMSAWVRPRCPGESPDDLAFRVRVEHADGQVELVRFLASDPHVLLPALDKWCSLEPMVSLSRTELWPDGTAIVHLTVSNPGPETARVEVPAYADAHAIWVATTEDVAPGELADVEVNGTEVDCDKGETGSWQRGRLLVDGESTGVRSWGDSYCG